MRRLDEKMHYSCLFEYCGEPINPHTIQYWSMFVCQKYPPFQCFTRLFAVLPVSLFSRKKKWRCSTNRTTGASQSPPPAVRLFDSSHLGDAVGQTKHQDQTAEWRLSCNTQGGEGEVADCGDVTSVRDGGFSCSVGERG